MKIFHPQKQPGFAVIVVMIAVTVLSLMAGLFAYSMKVESRLAYNSENDEQLLWLGRAGMERARWILALEGQQPFSSKNQIWAGGPGVGAETNGPLAGISLDNFQVGAGPVSLKFIEQESKININTADTPLLTQVLTAMGANAGDISTVSDSIQDWIDTDDSTRPAGAESDYYQGLAPSYYAKNAPMDDISELLLVKGVTLAMYNGGSGANDQGAAFQHHHLGFGNAPGQEPDYAFGLKDVFTPFSSGQVNLNTADATVLQLIPGMDTESVAGIIKWRAGPDGAEGTDDDTPFTSPGQLSAAGVSPAAIQQASRYLAVRGSTYEVHATAQIGNASREFIAILSRNGSDVHIFSFYWK